MTQPVEQEEWVAVEEPKPARWEKTTRDQVEMSCHKCGMDLGYVEAEYEGQYGLRLVQVWMDAWKHRDRPDVVYCEDCTL